MVKKANFVYTVGKMTELGSSMKLPERAPGQKQYNITFEPGNHPHTREEYAAIDKAFAAGDISAHIWNPEVGKRLSTIRPQILTIDGMTTTQDERGTTSKRLWEALPTTPDLLNAPKEGIFVVKGDQLSKSVVIDNVPKSLSSDISKQVKEDAANQETLVSVFFPLFMAEGILGGTLVLGSPFVPTKNKPISRRVLLKGMTALAGGSLGYHGFQEVTKEVTTPNRKQAIEDKASRALTEADKKRIVAQYNEMFPDPDEAWLSARNALYSLKTRGSYDKLQLPEKTPSAIIAGDDHLKSMEKILEDEEYAGSVLRTYVGGLTTIIDSFYNDNPDAAAKAKSQFLDFVALTQIALVRQPDAKWFKKSPLIATKAAVIEGVPYEDARVVRALDPLRS